MISCSRPAASSAASNAVLRGVHAFVELGVDTHDGGRVAAEVGRLGGRAVERDGGGQARLAGVEQQPGHRAAEAESDDAELAVGHASLQLVQARTHVLHEPLGRRPAEDRPDRALIADRRGPALFRHQVDRERGVARTSQPVSDGPDVVGETTVLVDDEDAGTGVRR